MTCAARTKGRGFWAKIFHTHFTNEETEAREVNNFPRSYFCFIDFAKAFDYVDHNKLWKILQEMGIPDNLTCLLINLYAGQEVTELDMEQQTGSKL